MRSRKSPESRIRLEFWSTNIIGQYSISIHPTRASPRRHRPSPYLFTAHPINLFGLAWLVTMSMTIHAFGTAGLGIRMGTAVARSLQLQAFAQGSIRHRHQVKSAHTFKENVHKHEH